MPSTVPAHGQLVVYVPFNGQSSGDAGGGHAVPEELLIERARSLGLVEGHPQDITVAIPTADGPQMQGATGMAFGMDRVIPALQDLEWHGPVWSSAVPASVRIWALATRLAAQLLTAECVLPDLARDGEGGLVGVWRAAVAGHDEAADASRALAHAMPAAAFALALDEDHVWDPSALVGAFLDAVVDHEIRRSTDDASPGRPRERILPWTARWGAALTDPADARVPLREGASELLAGVNGWREALLTSQESAVAELHLTSPDDVDGPWRLHLGVRTEDGRLIDAGDVWEAQGDDVSQEALLTGLARVARVFPPLEAVLDEHQPVGVDLGLGQAWQFISEVAELVDGQVIVRLPEDVREGDLRVRLRIGDAEGGDAEGGDAEGEGIPGEDATEDVVNGPGDVPALVGEEIAHWEVALGEDALDDAALDELLSADAPLVRWGGRWVRVDPQVAEHVRHLGPPRRIPLAEALGLAMAGSTEVDTDLPLGPVDVVTSGRVHDLVGRIRSAAERPVLEREPQGFVGRLRPYQRRGVAWLGGMAALGLGGVLADDMGLGKTVQLIAHLLTRARGPHLIVCPTSVVGNWEREIARFAPSLDVVRHHGQDRPTEPYADDVVVVTSYGTLRRDIDQLAASRWDVVTLDEAQFVKNPATAGARAVRKLEADQTIAMTGTPLENRLSELWSLLDATNPGLVGSRAAFGRRYVTPIEGRRDRSAARRLRRLVAPFVVRREKTDPDVAADLPDKIERTVVCPLTTEQAEAYRAATQRAMTELSELDGMRRRGRILALLTELKQICNHPAQGRFGARGSDGAGSLTGRSGKFETARAIVAEATGSGAQVLVFSQYVQMTKLLAEQLEQDLGVAVPVLHGGLSASARDRMVADFQGERAETPPVMVVSLRAGGTGLNLTAASHVLHYDRWWNPAVEDQATDRAHRFGQTSTVEVHKLVTSGTLEERIAELLEVKRDLADSVVGSGESWITELADGDLAELVALSHESQVMDFDDEGDGEGRGGQAGDALLEAS